MKSVLERELPAAVEHTDSPPPHRVTSAAAVSAGGTTPVPSKSVIGVLVGFENDVTPLVSFPGQSSTAAVPARSVIDVHGAHIGKDVILMFPDGGAGEPIILGVLRDDRMPGTAPGSHRIDLEADGQRLIVTASAQLVLKCGKARITLTRQGKVLIEGTFISTRSSGVNRIKGGSVQIN